MPTYRTPDVYVREIPVFPPSVAEVETAVPAFIGYTERNKFKGKDYQNKPTMITSLTEYKDIFGEGPGLAIESVQLADDNSIQEVSFEDRYYLYDSLELFYANGGGKCYIISIGKYGEDIDREKFGEGLEALKLEDEPTMIVFPDAALLEDAGELYSLQQAALQQASDLMDRFVIMDLKVDEDYVADVEGFRSNIGVNNLKYGAAYTPYLKASLPRKVYLEDLLDDANRSRIRRLDVVELDDDTLAKSDEVKANAVSYKNLISFKKRMLGHMKLGGVQHADVDKAYKALVKAFNATETSANQANFIAVLAYVYNLLKTVEDVARNSVNTHLTTTTLPADTIKKIRDASMEKFIQDAIKKDSAMREAVAKMNSYIISAPDTPLGTVGDFLEDPGNITASSGATPVGSTASGAVTFLATSDAWGDTFSDIASLTSDEIEEIYGDATVTTVGTKLKQALPFYYKEFERIRKFINDLLTAADSLGSAFEDTLTEQIPTYKNIKEHIRKEEAVIPPSGVIAGVYSQVDRTRGVWKAPANVSLNSVFDVTEKIDNQKQERLNVDDVAGKSVNAIRPFAGKGILVWGARTLAGNDNEWRYINVRRFFSTVEESCKKATYWAVFEPNDANLWVKVKAMLENYLIEKWRDGALQGAKPEHAFYVNVGLNKTMTAQDILEGRLIVEIGMAVVRPAEFIILKFMHKLMES